jgi:hypothetical protein
MTAHHQAERIAYTWLLGFTQIYKKALKQTNLKVFELVALKHTLN